MTTSIRTDRLAWATPAFQRRGKNTATCGRCGRRTGHRKDGKRIRHRTEADNPLAPYCPGDDDQ